ncbi:MAG: outer membrane protein assembly factor BamB [Proteobacteria bacterium]|nr:outer membrane protein assembly factor BamB [Pseudomonadota bacterium]
MTRAWAAAWLLLGAVLAGCSSDKPKPTPLETFTPSISGRQLWSANIGGIDFALSVAARNGQFIAASSGGSVLALNAETGAELWRAQAGAPLTAGVGSDGRYSAVVTRDNEVVTFDGAKQLWKQRIPSRVVTAPLVAGERVFVMAVDRSVHAFDVLDGRRLWTFQRAGDALTLAQAGVLMAARNQLLAGQGGRLVALDPLRGTVVWDLPIGQPRGSNEVERLADLVGPAVRDGDRLCARSFQTAVGCVDLAKNTVLWSRNSAGAGAVGGNGERLFGADAVDRVSAWNASNGDLAWTNERLLHRDLSGAVVVGSSVVFGDLQGQLHFLSVADGKTQLRLPTDGKPVIGTPLLAGNTLLVATKGGGLYAFRVN